MRRQTTLLLSGLLLVSACEAPSITAVGSQRAPRATAAPSARPAAQTAPSPSAAPSAAPTPAVPTSAVSGTVALDPAYLIASGGGNLIGQAGGNIIATGGGNLIGHAGGNITTTGGLQLIGQAGGNIIDLGAGIIAAGGGNYRTLASEAGSLLPVQGMVLLPISLVTRQVMGPPVRTDARGGFTLSIPRTAWKSLSRKENFLLFAAVPAESPDSPLLQDPRLQYSLIASSDQQAATLLDEDTATVSTFLRLIAQGRMATLFNEDDILGTEELCASPGTSVAPFYEDRLDPITQALLSDFSCKLIAMARKYQVPAERFPRVAEYLADTVLAILELDVALREPVVYRGAQYTHGLPALKALFADVREAAGERVAALDAEFGGWDGEDAGIEPDFRILRPSDASEYMVRRYLARTNDAYDEIDAYLPQLGYTPEEIKETRALLDSASWGMIMQMGVKFLALNNAQLLGDGVSPLERIMRELGEAPSGS